jgi:hypothetical protein
MDSNLIQKEEIIMTDAISGIISGIPPQQTEQTPLPQKAETKESAPQPKGDTVTISARGKQAAQQTAQYSPAEESKESSTQRAKETQAGKK